MLARSDPFLSAEALDLTHRQRDALVMALRFLEGKKVRTVNFDMSCWHMPVLMKGGQCGTAVCVGGLAEMLIGEPVFTDRDGNCVIPYELSCLFFPGHVRSCDEWSDLKPRQAALALRRYLETGTDGWREALSRRSVKVRVPA